LLVPRAHDGGERFTTSDIAVVRAGLALLEAGFPFSDLIALAREHNESTHAIAERAVALFDEHVRTPLRASDRSDREKADHLVAAFRVLLPATTALVEHHFRRVLLAVAQQHLESVGEEHELVAATAEAARRLESERFPS
jgi:DNA-binding transcriptional MerR regulator